MDFIVELWSFLRVRKKFWLLPLILVMLVIGGLILATQSSVIGPFLYSLF